MRRVRDRNIGPEDELFPVWRYHPFFTNSTEPIADADITHRRHAIIETVFADLIDGPLAHLPSGRSRPTAPGPCCAAITHNLLRAAGTLAGTRHAVARGATLRRHLVNVPARIARPQGRPMLHLPAHWPWATAGTAVEQRLRQPTPPFKSRPDHQPPATTGPTGDPQWKSWTDQQPRPPAPRPGSTTSTQDHHTSRPQSQVRILPGAPTAGGTLKTTYSLR